MVNYKVGDIIEEQAGGAPIRLTRVTQRKKDIKRGRSGFHGIEVDSDLHDKPTLPNCGTWGYDLSVIRVVRKGKR